MGWAEWLQKRRRKGRDVFAYFNNDAGGHAPRDAMRLREMLGQRATRGRGCRLARRPSKVTNSRTPQARAIATVRS